MKKLIFILLISLSLVSCGAMRLADVSNLSEGMTKAQVDNIMRAPVRLLSTSYKQDGTIEVYEYITYRQESYAVEFWNGRLSGYDFMYENTTPAPNYNRPGHVVRPPANPPRPSTPSRPGGRPETNRPGSNTGGRPNNGGSRPGTNNNTERPSGNTGTTRPSYNTGSTTTRSTTESVPTQSPATTTDKDDK